MEGVITALNAQAQHGLASGEPYINGTIIEIAPFFLSAAAENSPTTMDFCSSTKACANFSARRALAMSPNVRLLEYCHLSSSS